jgi:micrococcal nuclease
MTNDTGRAMLIAVAAAGLTLGAAGVLASALGNDRPLSMARTPQAPSPNGGRVQVLGVASGDTFSVGSDTRRRVTRIVGIDAPERGQCGFDGARRHLRSLIAGRLVALYWDALQPGRDRAGRLLRYVVSGRAADRVDVGYRAVAAGWARVSLEHDFLLVAHYLQAQARA